MNLFRLFFILILLGITKLSLAETELIDLSGYSKGDIPTYLFGQSLSVGQEVRGSEFIKYVTGQNMEGRIEYSIPNLTKNFEITLELDSSSKAGSPYYSGDGDDIFISLTANNETKFTFIIGYSMLLFPSDNDRTYHTDAGWERDAVTNTVKLKIQDGTVKSYVNSEFFQSTLLEQPNAIYNQLVISDLGTDDKIYSIVVNNLDGSPAGTTSSSTNTECVADYSAITRDIHIPCILVLDALGVPRTYDVYLNQVGNTVNFELDLDRVTAE